MKNNSAIKLSLFLNYFVFAILLNSVGIVILKSQKVFGVDEVQASVLEFYKDMPIAIVSFIVASFLPRIGYKRAMLIALGIVTVATMGMFIGNSFWAAKILFLCIGTAFALIKVSVYSSIGLITEGQSEHNSLMSRIEGVFMFGIALAYFLFPAFNSPSNPDAWLNVYPVLSGISIASFFLLLFSGFKEQVDIPTSNIKEDFGQMWQLMTKLLVIVFVFAAFLFVMIEQGIMTWLPTFNERVLALPENLAIIMASILAVSLGVGRILAGYLSERFTWFQILMVCLVCSMAIVLFILPKAANAQVGEINHISDIPFIGFVFPLIGLFIAPIYPLINSAILSALPKHLHSSMSGLIIIFSAIGGSFGSRIIGYLFKTVGGDKAFTYTIIPMIGLMIALFILRRLTAKQDIEKVDVDPDELLDEMPY